MLSPRAHLAFVLAICFGPMLLLMTVYDRLPEHLQKDRTVQGVAVVITLLLTTISMILVEKFVPARCPRCDGKMYSDGARLGVKLTCKDCSHVHRYF